MSRAAKRSIIAVALVLLLGVGAYAIALARATAYLQAQAEETHAELAALSKEVVARPRLAPWPRERPEPPKGVDARPVYERAATRFQAIDDEELLVLPEYLGRTANASREHDVTAFFAKHGELLEDLEDARLADRISLDPGLPDGLEAAGAAARDWQDVSTFLSAATRNALVLGQHDRALRLIEIHLCMGRDLERTGGVLNHLTGLWIYGRASGNARVLLAQASLDARALESFGQSLNRMEQGRPTAGAAWSVSGLLLRHTCARWGMHPNASPTEMTEMADWRHFYSTRIWLAEAASRLPSWTERLEALDAMTPMEAWAEAKLIRDAAVETDHAVIRLAVVVAPLFHGRIAEAEATRHLLRVSTALAGYRAAEGRWPATLEDLVPRWLDGVEPCPATGLPLGYEGGRVWSAGGDGDEDGGRAVDPDGDWGDDGDVAWDLEDRDLPDPGDDG